MSNGKPENTQYIDAVIGSADLFLFNIERIITNFSTRQGTATFDALSKSACQDRLDKVPDDVFRDVQLLLGGPFLPTFPLLDKSGGPKVSARDALNMLSSVGRSVIQLCYQWREDPLVQALDYEDRYKRAVLSLKHHVVLDKEGKATLMGSEYDAGDAHEFIGLRLPEELYFYISRAMLNPRVPNWLTLGEIDLTLPVGCEDSEAYRYLLGDQLTSLQTQTICLLSNSMNRFYQTRSIKIKTWYTREAPKTINMKEEPSVKDTLMGWKISEAALGEQPEGAVVRKMQVISVSALTRVPDQPGELRTFYGGFGETKMSSDQYYQRQLPAFEVAARDPFQCNGSLFATPRIREREARADRLGQGVEKGSLLP